MTDSRSNEKPLGDILDSKSSIWILRLTIYRSS